ncbi:hypothetical protein P885DRAFT_75354 [Corynascus similis CBS 632.67]
MDSGATAASDTTNELYVSPICFVQTAESRFGADVLDDLKTFVSEVPHEAEMGFDDDESDVDEEDEEQFLDEAEGALMDTFDWDGTPGVGLETDPNHAQHGFPRIATTRNNLTALSQRYNLYFAAYQDRIYVYQPRRTAPKILPSPSLILHPRQSKLGQQCGGVLDHRFPHQINHIIVGNLGELEIVLLAYDDGDTVAYYTHAIVRYIKTNTNQVRGQGASSGRQGTHPKPFFHENVGKSAWGLAIHARSRLIAVSSNLHEVIVFAFALQKRNEPPPRFSVNEDSPRTTSGLPALQLQKHLQSRSRMWRIILPLGQAGNNIPNICFLDDEEGNADKVVAIDIVGTVWFLDIWKVGTPPIRWPDAYARVPQMAHGVRGWGVLVLPYTSFQPAKTVREALGVPGGEVIPVAKTEAASRVWLDTTCSLYYIKGFSPSPEVLFRQRHTRIDYARTHAAQSECQESDLSDPWGSDSEDDEGICMTEPRSTEGDRLMYPIAAGQEPDRWSTITPFSNTPDSCFHDLSRETQLARSIVPSFGETPSLNDIFAHAYFNRQNSDRKHRTKHVDFPKAVMPNHVVKDFCLLRTSPTDVELQPFDREAPCVELKFLITHSNHFGGAGTPWDLHPAYSERLSMLIHVPELSLVVAGSPTGRVALLTLTKTAKRLHMTNVRHGFRVECVLPRKEEEDKKLRPACTLIGVAMSPVPSRPGQALELRPETGSPVASAPPMYRLMLHYKDHTILMYDVARGKDAEEALLIF